MYSFSFHTRTQEPYSLLLERREWKAKRDHILTRDGHRCQRCGVVEGPGVSLHVHHRHYIIGLDPWEYKDTELITLCEDCHQTVHKTEEVPELRLENGILKKVSLTPCYRCGGAGWFREYRHVQGGVCFRCLGGRYEEIVLATEDYAKEHNIDISDIQAGFRPMSDDDRSKIMTAVIATGTYDSERKYIALTMNDGKMFRAYPDFSMDCRPGDSLVVNTLLYKKRQYKNSENMYVVLKGTINRPGVHF